MLKTYFLKMPLTEEKFDAAPLKNMDIKTAFLVAGNRKRKASATVSQKTKNLKMTEDKSEEDVIDLTERDNSEVTGDCKENTDLNLSSSPIKANSVTSSETAEKEDKCAQEKQTLNNSSVNDLSEEDSDSSNHFNSSNLNISLNTSELSESMEIQNKVDPNTSTECNKLDSENQSKRNLGSKEKDTRPKKKKKMSIEEAKARSEEREQKQNERLLKKQEQEALKKQKKEELEKRKLQKEQEKREKEEERKERERLKLAKKEQEEKEKQQKLKEKEEQKKQRQLMIEMKQEEKKKKEEMRLKREEEKKKAEEEKRKVELEKEQKEKEKQEKAKAAFVKFFKKTVPTTSAVQVTETEGAFKPFQVSEDMTLAPVVPPVAQKRFNKEMLDRGLQKQGDTKLYLSILKCENYKDIRLRKRLRKQRTCDAEVIVFDNKTAAELFLNAKLLQFCENLRPAYWGTWRKKSKNIGPRKPFGKDDIFDYEVDSDDEWDEGGPGESLSGTENEMSSEDEYEVDNEFFVPHGYLSPEEEKEEDEVMNKENKQALLKLKQQEFEFERKKKTTELKPIILGCYFENIAESQDSSLGTILLQYAAEILSEGPIPTSFTIKKLQVESAPNSNVSSPSNIVKKKKISPVPEEAMPYLIRLLHGNAHGCDILIKEFQAFWQQHCQDTPDSENALADEVEKSAENCSPKTPEVSTKNISKRQLKLVIKKISSWGKSPNPALKKICWWVNDEVREKYGLLDAPIPNQWVMSTIPASDAGTPTTVKNNPSIKEFLLS